MPQFNPVMVLPLMVFLCVTCFGLMNVLCSAHMVRTATYCNASSGQGMYGKLRTSSSSCCGLFGHLEPEAKALIGVIVERTTAAHQNMNTIQEEALKLSSLRRLLSRSYVQWVQRGPARKQDANGPIPGRDPPKTKIFVERQLRLPSSWMSSTLLMRQRCVREAERTNNSQSMGKLSLTECFHSPDWESHGDLRMRVVPLTWRSSGRQTIFPKCRASNVCTASRPSPAWVCADRFRRSLTHQKSPRSTCFGSSLLLDRMSQKDNKTLRQQTLPVRSAEPSAGDGCSVRGPPSASFGQDKMPPILKVRCLGPLRITRRRWQWGAGPCAPEKGRFVTPLLRMSSERWKNWLR